MAIEFFDRSPIHIDFLDKSGVDRQIVFYSFERLHREIFNLQQLVDRVIPTEFIAIIDYLPSIIIANTVQLPESRSIGSIEFYDDIVFYLVGGVFCLFINGLSYL